MPCGGHIALSGEGRRLDPLTGHVEATADCVHWSVDKLVATAREQNEQSDTGARVPNIALPSGNVWVGTLKCSRES